MSGVSNIMTLCRNLANCLKDNMQVAFADPPTLVSVHVALHCSLCMLLHALLIVLFALLCEKVLELMPTTLFYAPPPATRTRCPRREKKYIRNSSQSSHSNGSSPSSSYAYSHFPSSHPSHDASLVSVSVSPTAHSRYFHSLSNPAYVTYVDS